MMKPLHKFTKLSGCLLILIWGVAPCFAGYSWQISGSYHSDSSSVFESTHYNIGATRYFKPVEIQDAPYELAPFARHSSYLVVAFTSGERKESLASLIDFDFASLPEFDLQLPFDIDIDLEIDVAELTRDYYANTMDFSIGGRYVLADSGWYVGGRISQGAVDRPRRFLEVHTESSAMLLNVGKYLGELTTLEMRYGASVEDTSAYLHLRFAPANFRLNFGSETATENWGISLRRAGLLGDIFYWLSINAGTRSVSIQSEIPDLGAVLPQIDLERSTSATHHGLTAGIYPRDEIGVRFIYSEGADSNVVGISGSWFFTPSAAVELNLARLEVNRDIYAGKLDSISIRLLWRGG